jgi:hypothetical protein
MKNIKLFTICLFLLAALFISSCDGSLSGASGNIKSFSNNLLGTWESK